ncbi:MAG: hypothetical protein R2853_19255 [Thermomicrobiales bacterium]
MGHQARCCEGRPPVPHSARGDPAFDTDADGAYAWLDDKLWIEIFNPFGGEAVGAGGGRRYGERHAALLQTEWGDRSARV